MNYEIGIPLARILYKNLDKILKYDTKEPEIDVDSEESRERFGNKQPLLSLMERLLKLDEADLVNVLSSDPSIKKRLKNEINNGNVPLVFSPVKFQNGKREKVEIPGSRFIPTFNPKDFREIVYIYGPSGAGKSSLCRSYIDEYRKEFPSNGIYVFSLKENDVTLEDKNITRIPNRLDVLAGINFDTLRDSLVIFDDVDGYDGSVTSEQKQIYRICDAICQIGRDRRVFCIITTHMACKGARTKVILNECHKIIVFPGRSKKRTLKYLLEEYAGMSHKNVKEITDLQSRWACIHTQYPSHVIYENGCYTL